MVVDINLMSDEELRKLQLDIKDSIDKVLKYIDVYCIQEEAMKDIEKIKAIRNIVDKVEKILKK